MCKLRLIGSVYQNPIYILSQKSHLLMRIYTSVTLVPYEIVYAYCSLVYNMKKLETSVDVVGTNNGMICSY